MIKYLGYKFMESLLADWKVCVDKLAVVSASFCTFKYLALITFRNI